MFNGYSFSLNALLKWFIISWASFFWLKIHVKKKKIALMITEHAIRTCYPEDLFQFAALKLWGMKDFTHIIISTKPVLCYLNLGLKCYRFQHTTSVPSKDRITATKHTFPSEVNRVTDKICGRQWTSDKKHNLWDTGNRWGKPHDCHTIGCGVKRRNTGGECPLEKRHRQWATIRCCKFGKKLESLGKGRYTEFSWQTKSKKRSCEEKFLQTTTGLHGIFKRLLPVIHMWRN